MLRPTVNLLPGRVVSTTRRGPGLVGRVGQSTLQENGASARRADPAARSEVETGPL